MSNKTPYEIRADLLVLAQRICYDKHRAKSNMLADEDNLTSAPTAEEVIAEATKLNRFVSNT